MMAASSSNWHLREKLRGMSPLLWINRDSDLDRRRRMESQQSEYGLEAHRIAAVDGRSTERVSQYVRGDPPSCMTASEVACTLSHLLAIDKFLESDDADFAVICEDDVDFEPVKYWPFRFADLLAALPSDWDCVQLTIVSMDGLNPRLHRRKAYECSACAYVIRRGYAARLRQLLLRGGQYDLSISPVPAFADHLIYGVGTTYSIPVFLHRAAFGSTIHSTHVWLSDCCEEALLDWWKTEGVRANPAELLSV
jgi:GR25 family glycosyltransferase involved in LPS biosynthesis